MATAPKLQVVPNRPTQTGFDYMEKCRCGHHRFEHHSSFGCMQWDERRARGWCHCDGFAKPVFAEP